MESDQNYNLRVLMLPWLAHGHISPFLELAKRLVQRNFFVYLCSTPVNISSIKTHLPSIQLVELHLPDLPDLPSHLHTTKSLPSHLMPVLKCAFDLAAPSFSQILKSLNPDLLIYDFIQPWAPAAASTLDIPSVMFLTTGAAFTSFISHLFDHNENEKFRFPAIYLEEHEARKAFRMFGSRANGLTDLDRFKECTERSCDFIAVKSFMEIERKYLEYLSYQLKKEVVPVGPLVEEGSTPEQDARFRRWLDEKERGSTVLASFGSEYFMSKEEMEELAHGLELSQVNFIWVVRFPDGAISDFKEMLPSGFQERVQSRGLVVEGWVPQRSILQHPSVGGFLTHCGWSSVMEAMRFGVPMIALPLHIDQPLNARLVAEVGVGAEVKKERVGEGRFGREEVGRRIREVVTESGGEGVRKKAREMGERMSRKGEEEIDILVEKLRKLCNKIKSSE